jgi:hypothetical protein
MLVIPMLHYAMVKVIGKTLRSFLISHNPRCISQTDKILIASVRTEIIDRLFCLVLTAVGNIVSEVSDEHEFDLGFIYTVWLLTS